MVFSGPFCSMFGMQILTFSFNDKKCKCKHHPDRNGLSSHIDKKHTMTFRIITIFALVNAAFAAQPMKVLIATGWGTEVGNRLCLPRSALFGVHVPLGSVLFLFGSFCESLFRFFCVFHY